MPPVNTPTFSTVYGVAEAEICNRGLIRIAASLITDTITDNSIQANTCKSVYAVSRNELLRYVSPAFASALDYATIDDFYTDPLDGYLAAYDTSALNILRLIRVAAKEDAVYSLVGSGIAQRLLTSEAATVDSTGAQAVEVRYIKEIEDPSKFDDLFVEALALRIAYKCAVGIVQNPTLLQILKGEADQAAYVAKMASFSERQTDPFDTAWTQRS